MMTSQPNCRPFSNLESYSQGAALIAISVGCLGVIGWTLGINRLTGVLEGLPLMVPNTAVALILAGLSLWWVRSEPGGKLRRLTAKVCALAVAVIGGLTLAEFLLGANLGIDQLLFRESLSQVHTPIPGRPAFLTALSFLLFGLSQLLLGVKNRTSHGIQARRLPLVPVFSELVREITGRKEAEQALRQSEARFSTIFRASPAAISINTVVGGRLIEVNDLYCEIYGYRREELIGRTVEDLKLWANPEDRAPVMERLLRERSIRGLEAKSRLKSGEVRIMLASLDLIELAGESEPVLISMFTDITERKRAEDALRASEAYSRNLISSSLDMIIAVDRDRRIIEFNPAAQRTFGYPPDEILGQPIDLLYADPCLGLNIHTATIEQGSRIQEILNKRRNGEVFPSLLASSALRDARGEVVGVMGISRDITEKNQLELRMLRNQRLECLGTLAGGIAHDLNNVLTPILMSLQMLQAKYTDPDDQRLLALIESSGNRGADMVKQVLAFARGVQGERTLIQIAHLINELEKMLRQTVPKSIQVRTAVPRDLWELKGDATQLHQVLMNLCVNARDAMPDGGTLTMEAANSQVDPHYAEMNPDARAGHYVIIRITDTGTGMPAQIKERIFEPFFTTKPMEKGSGLGLPTALGIVKSHGGFLEVSSELGRGTEFKVYLPAQQPGAPERAEAERSAVPTGNGEMVLVVDDEASILNIAKQTLQRFGYQVLTATDGVEAISICAQHLGTIQVIITDMMMPIMEGPATIRAALSMDPDLKIIGVSGLDYNFSPRDSEQLNMHAFLKKPFSAEQLVRSVHDVLQGKAAQPC